MLIIESKNVRIQINDDGIIESIKCECDGIYYSAKPYPLKSFFEEVRDIAFKKMLTEDKEMFQILLSHIEKDKKNYEYAFSLLNF